MDLKEIKEILDMIAESDVNQVTIEEGDFKIKVKKTADVVQGSNAPVQYQMPAAAQQPAIPPQQPQGQQAENEETQSGQENQENGSGKVVKSPIVGTFYRSPSPEDDVFVKVGDQIEKGETLCIIEAMKIMNEIESEYSGSVDKILVEDGEAVEFEQPLFIIG